MEKCVKKKDWWNEDCMSYIIEKWPHIWGLMYSFFLKKKIHDIVLCKYWTGYTGILSYVYFFFLRYGPSSWTLTGYRVPGPEFTVKPVETMVQDSGKKRVIGKKRQYIKEKKQIHILRNKKQFWNKKKEK